MTTVFIAVLFSGRKSKVYVLQSTIYQLGSQDTVILYGTALNVTA